MAAPEENLGVSEVPRFTIDLDAPPGERWNEVVDAYEVRWVEFREGRTLVWYW